MQDNGQIQSAVSMVVAGVVLCASATAAWVTLYEPAVDPLAKVAVLAVCLASMPAVLAWAQHRLHK